MKKYAVHPGYVPSKNDGDIHFISASKLMKLYGVKPTDCVVCRPDHETYGIQNEDYIHLHPRYHGDYALPDKPAEGINEKRAEERKNGNYI